MEKMEDQIRKKLSEHFKAKVLEVLNESYKHSSHADADAESHFFVRLHCDAFQGKSLVEQHREVYAVLKDFVPKPVHALRLETKA